MATAFAHDVPDTAPPLARAAGKLAAVTAAGTAEIAKALPQPDAWASAKAAYLAAKTAEDDYDTYVLDPHEATVERVGGKYDLAIGEKSERLTAIRFSAEDALMSIPSPDGEALAFKYIVAKGNGRETSCWDAILEADAKRLAIDAALIAELRGKGLVGPISADFLADYGQRREFAMLARQLCGTRHGMHRFRRALVRAGTLPSDDPTDASLIDAWERWKVASARIEATLADTVIGAHNDDIQARDDAETLILETAAATPAGAAVKLRFALDTACTEMWVNEALIAGNDMALMARADELDVDARLIVDTLALLVRPAETTVRDAFEAWAAARLAYDLAPPDESLNGDGPLMEAIIRTEAALAAASPATPEDMLYKLMPLALHEHGPNMYEGTFAIRWTPRQEGTPLLDDEMWRGLIDGMLKLSPRIAELEAMPKVQPVQGDPEMWLPDTALPVEQMTTWLGHLAGEPAGYGKLWLRLMASVGVSVFIDPADGGPTLRVEAKADGDVVQMPAACQALREHMDEAGHRQAVVDRLVEIGGVMHAGEVEA